MRPAPHRMAERLARETIRRANRRTNGRPCLFADEQDRARLEVLCEAVAEVLAPLIDEARVGRPAKEPNHAPRVSLPN